MTDEWLTPTLFDEGSSHAHESQTTESTEGEAHRDDELYKKWFRTRDKSGFLSLRGWFDAGKVAIDIGEASNGKLAGATQVWTNALALATYLEGVTSGQGLLLYPAQPRASLPAEAFVYYGGGTHDGKPVSRILKVTYWGSGDNVDTSAFAWKTGHFAARRSESGAYLPDMSSPLSTNMIKMTRVEMAEMSLRLRLALTAFAAGQKPGAVLAALSGGRR